MQQTLNDFMLSFLQGKIPHCTPRKPATYENLL